LPNKLQKTANDPLPKQRNKLLLPIQVNNNNKWKIEKILACKLTKGMLKYCVNWKGYNLDPTWYPA